MSSVLMCRRDLDFLLHEWLEIETLLGTDAYLEHSRETVDAVLDLAEQMATRDFAPINRLLDANEPTFDGNRVHQPAEVKRALDAYFAAGFGSMGAPAEHGGSQIPQTVQMAAGAWFSAANSALTGYAFLTGANANLLLKHGTPEQIAQWAIPQLDGRYFGTMCLSEPHAGSSLADITTRAELQPDGTYRVTGNKMWISAGDHELSENIVHLVLAKIPGGPPGVKGISLLIVPKVLPDGTRNDVSLAGLNHKLGGRGTTNTALNFGEGAHLPGGRPGAVGYLVGEPHRGLSYMFTMMNEARIGIGVGATSLGYTGYLHSLEYARNRPQGRALTNVDQSGPMVPIIDHADVRRMLLAQKSYVEGALALVLYCAHLVDQQATSPDPDRDRLLLDVLVPIVKSWPSQWCLAANDLAIQVYGGCGYTRDYPVEQFYRDNRLNPIHEGTHGIQAMDLLGRKVTMKGGAGLPALLGTINVTIERALQDGGQAADYARQLRAAAQRAGEVTAHIWGTGDIPLAMANATVYLEALGHVVIAWMWLEQLLAVGEKSGDFYTGKRQAARYFYAWELPKTRPMFDLLESLDRTTLDMQSEWF